MKISHGIEYAAARFCAGLFQLMPHHRAVRLGDRIGRLVDRLWKTRHSVITNNLKIAFGDDLSEKQRDEMARVIFGNIGRTLAEMSRFSRLSREDILSLVTSEGEEAFQEALDYGKGAILTGCHFGNWELIGAYVRARGFPVDFLIRGQHNQMVDRYMTRLRENLGVGVINSEQGMTPVIRALKANRQVAIVSDQHAGSNGIIVRFFDQLVSVPRAPATLAVRLGCPLITGFMLRRPDDTHHCVFDRPVYPDPDMDPQKEILHLTRVYTRRFEKTIRRHPELWLWTHRRFKPLGDVKLSEGDYVE